MARATATTGTDARIKQMRVDYYAPPEPPPDPPLTHWNPRTPFNAAGIVAGAFLGFALALLLGLDLVIPCLVLWVAALNWFGRERPV